MIYYLVVMAYVSAPAAAGGGQSVHTNIHEFKAKTACEAVGQGFSELGGDSLSWKCIATPAS